MMRVSSWRRVFFFNDTATTEIYTLSLHDALPIWNTSVGCSRASARPPWARSRRSRSEEHTSELQSPCNLVCRLLLEKKKKTRSRGDAQSASLRTSDHRSEPRPLWITPAGIARRLV